MSNLKVVGDQLKEMLKTGEIDPAQAVEAMHSMVTAMHTKRTYIPPTREDIKGVYARALDLRRRAQESQVPFISIDIDEVKLYQGLILIGGVSGQGKSTTAANIVAGYLENVPSGRAMFITNEENTADVYDRVACVMAKKNFKSYRRGALAAKDHEQVQRIADSIMDRLLVEEGSERYDMTCLEDTQAALLHIADSGYGLGAIDYLQTVTWSREQEDLDPVRVSKELGFFLKDFSRKVAIPVVAFAQIKPKSESQDFKNRIENDRTIYNHAVIAIEVIPDFASGATKFVIHKDRFGESQNKEIEMIYEGGRFIPMGGI